MNINSLLILAIGYSISYTFIDSLALSFIVGVATVTVIEINQGGPTRNEKE